MLQWFFEQFFKGTSPHIMKDIFQFRGAVPYQLRKQRVFQNSVFRGTESIQFFGRKSGNFYLMK